MSEVLAKYTFLYMYELINVDGFLFNFVCVCVNTLSTCGRDVIKDLFSFC